MRRKCINLRLDTPARPVIIVIIQAGQIHTGANAPVRGKHIGLTPTNAEPVFEGKLWQRNYYEHIIRTERAYQQISD
jgi:hypothetical protein